MADEDTKLQVLHDHYKDSFGFLQHSRKERDWLFVLLVAALILMLFQLSAPSQSGQAISEAVSTRLGLASRIDISFLGSVIWLALLGLLLRYCQTVVTMERQYKYIHALEELLSSQYANKAFTREGKSYLADYPLLSSWASFFYTVLFPVLLLAVACARIVQELAGASVLSPVLAFDAIAYVAVVTSAVLYLISIHRPRRRRVPRRKLPPNNWLQLTPLSRARIGGALGGGGASSQDSDARAGAGSTASRWPAQSR